MKKKLYIVTPSQEEQQEQIRAKETIVTPVGGERPPEVRETGRTLTQTATHTRYVYPSFPGLHYTVLCEDRTDEQIEQLWLVEGSDGVHAFLKADSRVQEVNWAEAQAWAASKQPGFDLTQFIMPFDLT